MLLLPELADAQIFLYRQRFLVEDQPQVISMSYENFLPLGDSELNLGQTDYNLKHNYYRLQGFIVPVANNSRLLMSLGLGYAADVFEDQIPSDLTRNNQAFWLQWFHTGSIGKQLFWRSLTAYGAYTEQKLELGNETLRKFSQFVELGYKWNPRLATSLGGLFLSNYGDFTVVPIAHLAYSYRKWIFDLLLPIDASVRYILNSNLHLMTQHLINSRSYWYSNRMEALNYSSNQLMIKAELRMYKVLWGEAGLVYNYSEGLEWQQGESLTDFGVFQEPVQLKLGAFIRFESKTDN